MIPGSDVVKGNRSGYTAEEYTRIIVLLSIKRTTGTKPRPKIASLCEDVLIAMASS